RPAPDRARAGRRRRRVPQEPAPPRPGLHGPDRARGRQVSRRPLALALSIRSAQETSRARGTHLARALLLAALGVAVLSAHSSTTFGQGAGVTLLWFTA